MKPLRRQRVNTWPSQRAHLLSWILSVELARQHFAETSLVTDDEGAELLVEQLGLHFETVSLSLNCLAGTNPDWWAIGKLHAYAEQAQPFVHIDNDVFLWEPLPARLLVSPLFCQHPEITPLGASYYRPDSIEADIQAKGGWMPEEFASYVPVDGQILAANCGIIGGCNARFIRHYARQALGFIGHERNQAIWSARSGIEQDIVLFEQLMITACVLFHQGRQGSPYSDIAIDYLFPSFGDAMQHADAIGYTHMIAGSKRNPLLTHSVENLVRTRFPDLYERALRLEHQSFPA